MSNTDTSPKPAVGTTVPLEVKVKSIWTHVTIVVASVMTGITAILAVLVQLKELPFLPTNVLAWITVSILVLTQITQMYQKLFGKPAVTPTSAAKQIQEESK